MPKRRVSVEAARDLLWGTRGAPGIIEDVVGFAPSSNALKNVHFMTDLAQTVLGGLPPDAGDLLCRVIREGLGKDDEDNSEATLRMDKRFGASFSRAYPVTLGAAQVKRLRLGARALLNVDTGMYAAGSRMASSVATNQALLGADQFRRFRMGAYLARVLDGESKERLKRLYESDADPVSFALKPLFQPGLDVAKAPAARAPVAATPFEDEFGRALGQILQQPLSKPAVLRALALGGCLGFVLKTFGAGMEGGRPLLLALSGEVEDGPGPLREKAVLSLRRCGVALDRRLAHHLAQVKDAKALWRDAKTSEAAVDVEDGAPDEVATSIVEALRRFRSADDDVKDLYWPQDAMLSLGRKAGIILPRSKQAGWGTYLALSPEMVEVLTLMVLPWGQRREWRSFWAEVHERFGIVIGTNDDDDMRALEAAGVLNVSLEDLSDNAERILAQSVRRGVARRLPDSGAEVGGYEQ